MARPSSRPSGYEGDERGILSGTRMEMLGEGTDVRWAMRGSHETSSYWRSQLRWGRVEQALVKELLGVVKVRVGSTTRWNGEALSSAGV